MREIVKTTRYVILKPVTPDTKVENPFSFVRAQTDGLNTHTWGTGYINHFGLVSFVGGEISKIESDKLENEYQTQLKANEKESTYINT